MDKRKIALCSYYVSGNIGDLLIAQQVTKLFSSVAECKKINMMNGEPFYGYQLLTGETTGKQKTVKRALLNHPILGYAIKLFKTTTSKKPARFANCTKECDWVIFAGGNQIMELSHLPIGTLMLWRIISKIKKNGKHIAFCFCGIGPLNSSSRYLTKQILKKVDFLSVRDNASFALIKQIDPTVKMEIWRDPVLAMYGEKQCADLQSKNIGVNVYFGPDSGMRERVKAAYISFIKRICEGYPDYRICLFSSTQSDYADIEECMEALAGFANLDVIRIYSAEELFDQLKSFGFVIGTRMHTLITSMCTGVPIMAISWQEKVSSLMKYMQIENLCITQEQMIRDSHCINTVFDDAFAKRNEIVRTNDHVLRKTKEEITATIECFRKEIYYGNI